MSLIIRRSADIQTEPLDVGDGRLSLVDLIAQPEGAAFTGGIAEVWHAAPVEFEYDDDAAICFILEGQVELSSGDESWTLQPGDVVYVPQQAGLTVDWHTPDYARFAYVTYPHWR